MVVMFRLLETDEMQRGEGRVEYRTLRLFWRKTVLGM